MKWLCNSEGRIACVLYNGTVMCDNCVQTISLVERAVTLNHNRTPPTRPQLSVVGRIARPQHNDTHLLVQRRDFHLLSVCVEQCGRWQCVAMILSHGRYPLRNTFNATFEEISLWQKSTETAMVVMPRPGTAEIVLVLPPPPPHNTIWDCFQQII